MQFTREIKRLLIVILLLMAAIGGVATYWVIVGPEELLQREDNPRLVEDTATIERGSLLDRNGELLAITERERGERAQRLYPEPAIYGSIGYYSLRYGVGGIEAAHDAILSGDDQAIDLQAYFNQEILHIPQQGADVRTTFNLTIQQQAVDLLAGHQGALVLISVPDGEIWSMVSLPTYDPNQLDPRWDELIEAPGDPFFNRAVQGDYQTGGLMQILLTSLATVRRFPPETTFNDATAPVAIADVELNCATAPPDATLTLRDATIYGCPAPFADYYETLTPDQLRRMVDLFRLDEQVSLDGFAVPAQQTADSTEEPTTRTPVDNAVELADALGQGDINLSPLHMVTLTAAFINAGNAPYPHTILETRPPDSDEWQAVTPSQEAMPITTLSVSRQMQAIMRQAVERGMAGAAARDGLDIGGVGALAFSGEETLAWFTGFARIDNRQGFAVALVLEDSDNLDLAASIGGDVLAAAVNAAGD